MAHIIQLGFLLVVLAMMVTTGKATPIENDADDDSDSAELDNSLRELDTMLFGIDKRARGGSAKPAPRRGSGPSTYEKYLFAGGSSTTISPGQRCSGAGIADPGVSVSCTSGYTCYSCKGAAQKSGGGYCCLLFNNKELKDAGVGFF